MADTAPLPPAAAPAGPGINPLSRKLNKILEARLLAVRRAVLEYELGVNHTDTEELSAGEEHLQRCTQLLEPHRLSRDCVSLYIQAQVGGGCAASSCGVTPPG